jgi:hypothetical protein
MRPQETDTATRQPERPDAYVWGNDFSIRRRYESAIRGIGDLRGGVLPA